MAIMQRCCCFDNVRSGSTASGVFTLIHSVLVLAYAAYQLSVLVPYAQYYGVGGFFIGYCFGVLIFVLLLIFSILLLVGVSKDQRGYLIPYMVVMPMLILLETAYCIFIIVGIALLGSYGPSYGVSAGIAVLVVELIIAGLLTVMAVICFLCVVSQYTELRDGRGRLQDVMAARTVVVATTTQGFGGAVVVTQQGGVPQQNYAINAPQQGYALNQGYPA